MMQNALDGHEHPEGELAQHLRECEACRSAWSRQQRLAEWVSEARACPADARERATRAVAQVAMRGQRPMVTADGAVRARALQQRRLLPHLAWGCAVVAAFWLGLHLRTTQVVTNSGGEPVVREKLVRVEVPVVRDRVVEKVLRVPVVRTRVVTRIVRVPVPATGVPVTRAADVARDVPRPPEPEPPSEERPEPVSRLVQTYPAPDPLPAATYNETIQLARLATSPAGE